MRDKVVLAIFSIVCLTILAISYWIILKQDSSVLVTISATIGAIAGYLLKKKR